MNLIPSMTIPIINGRAEKIAAVYNFLTEGPEDMLIIVGMQGGGEGKSTATNEAVRRWIVDVGPDNIRPIRICANTGTGHKQAYLNKTNYSMKIIVHTNLWNEHWVAMAKEWGAQTVIFRLPLLPEFKMHW